MIARLIPTLVADSIENLERIKSAYEITLINLKDYQLRPGANQQVIDSAVARVELLRQSILDHELSLKNVRGY